MISFFLPILSSCCRSYRNHGNYLLFSHHPWLENALGAECLIYLFSAKVTLLSLVEIGSYSVVLSGRHSKTHSIVSALLSRTNDVLEKYIEEFAKKKKKKTDRIFVWRLLEKKTKKQKKKKKKRKKKQKFTCTFFFFKSTCCGVSLPFCKHVAACFFFLIPDSPFFFFFFCLFVFLSDGLF